MPAALLSRKGTTPAFLPRMLRVGLCLVGFPAFACASIGVSGDIQPADPATWTPTTNAYIGKSNNGTLSINGGSAVENGTGYIAYYSGTLSTVTVNGMGSTWTNNRSLYVGRSGNGTLTLLNGAQVANGGDAHIGSSSGSIGKVTLNGTNSTWTNTGDLLVGWYGAGALNIENGARAEVSGDTKIALNTGSTGEIHFNAGTLATGSLWARAAQLTGSGTIKTHGLIPDADLVLDSTDDLIQTLTLNGLPGQNIAIHLDLDGQGCLGAGYAGHGSLAITHAVAVSSTEGAIGCLAGATGQVTVAGEGSTWTNSANLDIGIQGTGTLAIAHGGSVSCVNADIGTGTGKNGAVTVADAGSLWTIGSGLDVGIYGNGALNIDAGGCVAGAYATMGVNGGSTGVVHVDGPGAQWTLSSFLRVGRSGRGTLTIVNGGLVKVGESLTIDYNQDGDSFVNMDTGGRLAVWGHVGESLADFLALISGTGAIRYWDAAISDWADISGATNGVHYTLNDMTAGDLAGYTVLTVRTCDPDISQDGTVNLMDYAILAAHWLEADCSGPDWCDRADLDHSHEVGISDLQILTQRWQ